MRISRTNLTTVEDERLTKRGICEVASGSPATMLTRKLEDITLDDVKNLGVWRPETSYEVLAMMAHGQSVLIRGSAGCGKGAVLTGVWQTLRMLGMAHCWYDGHFRELPVEDVEEVLNTQIQQQGIFLFDSLDYLYAGKRKVRKISKKKHLDRVARVFPLLQKVPILVGTVHDNAWMEKLGDPDIISGHFNDLVRKKRMQIYDTPEDFVQEQNLVRFLRSKEFSEEEIRMLTTLKSNHEARTIFFERWPSTKRWRQFLALMQNYGTIKLIASDVFGEHTELQMLMRGSDRKAFYRALFDYVFRKDYRLLFHAYLQ